MAVPAAFHKEWLDRRLRGPVLAALQKIDYGTRGAGHVERVEYVVEAAA